MLLGAVTVVQPLRLRPVQKLGGGCRHDGAHTVLEPPVELHIPPSESIPERQVLRVECPLGDDRFLAHQTPVDAVRRLERHQASVVAAAADGLVPLVGRTRRVAVPERHEVVRPNPFPDDVVRLGAVELEQAQLRLGPVDPVFAGGVAGPLLAVMGRPGVEVAGPVVHAKQSVVLEHGDIPTGVPLPGRVEHDSHLAPPRSLEPQLNSLSRLDQVVVHERLEPRPQLDRLGCTGHPTSKHPRQQHPANASHCHRHSPRHRAFSSCSSCAVRLPKPHSHRPQITNQG